MNTKGHESNGGDEGRNPTRAIRCEAGNAKRTRGPSAIPTGLCLATPGFASESRWDSQRRRLTGVAARAGGIACGLVLMLAFTFAARADVTNQFRTDFTNNVLPAGVTLFGNATLTNENPNANNFTPHVALTQPQTTPFVAETGACVIADFSGGRAVNAFDASFRMSTYSGFGSIFGDAGFSFGWGPDLADGAFDEQGSGTNLVVSFNYVQSPSDGGVYVYQRVNRKSRAMVTRGINSARMMTSNGIQTSAAM